MRPRILTRFLGPWIEAEHDTATGLATKKPGGEALACTLAEFLRACSDQAGLHRTMGYRYRIQQEIEDDAGGPEGRPEGGRP